jgi:hypothetical protein
METKERTVTKSYIEHYVNTIRKGNPVTFVESDNLLGVDHPEEGYLVLQIADKVVEDG